MLDVDQNYGTPETPKPFPTFKDCVAQDVQNVIFNPNEFAEERYIDDKLMLCITQVLVAPLAYFAGSFIAPLPNRAQLRPVMYLTCIAAVCLFELLVLKLAKGPRSGQLIRILPVAAVNSGVLGTVLVERTQSFTLEQSLGFGLGSGLGYLLAVMLVTEAQNRLRSRAIPEAFRGLPVTLIYIGVLALAIYGFTGHSVIL